MKYDHDKGRFLDDWEADLEEDRPPRRPAPGKVTLTEKIPVQRRAKPEVRPAKQAPEEPPFAFVRAYDHVYDSDDKKPSGPAFPDELPVAFLASPAEQACRDAFDFDYTKPVQRAAAATADADADTVHAAAAKGIEAPSQSLPHLEQIQKSFGRHDVSHVQAHVGGAAAEASAAMGAEAYATGNDVAFASSPDVHTAAHEAAHVVQQKGGVQLKGGVGEAGDAYERHADAVADKVVAGESAEALLDEMAGGSTLASSGAIQHKKGGGGPRKGASDGEDGELTLPDGVNYEIIGNSTSLNVRRSWFESEDGVKSDRMQELLEHLRESGPLWWAEPSALRRVAQETKVLSFGGKTSVIQVDLSAMVYNAIGLPPRVSAMVSGVGESLQITIRADDVTAEPGTELPLREETAQPIIDAVARFTGLAPVVDANAQLREIKVDAWGGRGVVSARLERQALDAMFGRDAVRAWLDAHHGSGKKGTSGARQAETGVISDLTPDEAAWLKSWLAMKLERGSDKGGLLDRTMYELARKIEELKNRSPDAYNKVFEELRRGDVGPLTAMALERAIVEGEAASLGVARPEGQTLDPIHPVPLPARIDQRGGRVVSGEEVPFLIQVDWPPMIVGDQATQFRFRPFLTNVDWVFEKITGQAPVPNDKPTLGEQLAIADFVMGSARRHQTYEGGPTPENVRFRLADGEFEATWQVHAIVRHSHFLPAHLTTQVTVKSESLLMTELRAEATEGMGDNITGAPATLHSSTLDDNFGPDAYKNGFKFTGVLPEDFQARSPQEQGQIRTREIENARAMLEQLRKSHAGDTVIASAQRYLDGLERMDKAIEKDEAGGWRNFEIRGTFMSRVPGIQDGPLELYGLVSYAGGDKVFGSIQVRLRDLSRRFDVGDMTTEGVGETFEDALRQAFDKLCKAYPAGRVFVLAQDQGRRGAAPTKAAIGFELDTGTTGEDIKAKVWDPTVQAAVNLVGMATMIFVPGSASIVMPALAVYNAAQTIDDMHENWVRGTLTMEKKALGIASVGLDILPFLGRAKPILGSRRAWMVLEGVDIGGEAVYMTATTLAAARQIQEVHVAAMADIYAQMVELESSTHPADPRLVALKKQFDERALKVRGATVEAFKDAAIQRGTFVAAKGAFRGAKQLTEFLGDLGGRNMFLEKPGVAPHYDHERGRIVGDPRHPSFDEDAVVRMLAEQDAHMRELAVTAAEDLGLRPDQVEVVIDADITVAKRNGGVRLGYLPGVKPEAARGKWKAQHSALAAPRAGGRRTRTSEGPAQPGHDTAGGRGKRSKVVQGPTHQERDPSLLDGARKARATQDGVEDISPVHYDPETNKAYFEVIQHGVRSRVESDLPARITSASELRSFSNRIIGRPIDSVVAGHQILRAANRGDLTVLAKLGVDVPPGTALAGGIEFGLGKLSDGRYVVIRGEPSAVDWKALPGVEPIAHTHPLTPNNVPRAVGVDHIAMVDIADPNDYALDPRNIIYPSAPDIVVVAQRGVKEHRVLTELVLNRGKVEAPQPGDDSPRLEWVIRDAEYVGTIPGHGDIYRAVVVGEVGGKAVVRQHVWANQPPGATTKPGNIYTKDPSPPPPTVPRPPLSPEQQARLDARRDDLARALAADMGRLGKDVDVRVLDASEFKARFRSEKGRAVFVLEDGIERVYVREDGSPEDVRHELTHVKQLQDVTLGAEIRKLHHGDLENWDELSTRDRMGQFLRKLHVEIEAAQRHAAEGSSHEDHSRTPDASPAKKLAALRALEQRALAIGDDELSQMSAGVREEPDFLKDPAWLFTKVYETIGDRQDRYNLKTDARLTILPDSGLERSAAYNRDGVKNVYRVGDEWTEIIHVASDHGGTVSIRGEGTDKVTVVVTDKEGKEHLYALEKGAQLRVADGKEVKPGELLADEKNRRYRLVQMEFHDKRPPDMREEVLDVTGKWVQRGSESTRRGSIAEHAARLQADANLAKAGIGKLEAGGVSGYRRVKHQRGGGGFDDVILVFSGTAEKPKVLIKIREVKDYPDKYVPKEEFTAIRPPGLGQNLKVLRDTITEALLKLDAGLEVDGDFAGLTVKQLEAVRDALDLDNIQIEIVIGQTTKMGRESQSEKQQSVLRELRREIKADRNGKDVLAGPAGGYEPERISADVANQAAKTEGDEQ